MTAGSLLQHLHADKHSPPFPSFPCTPAHTLSPPSRVPCYVGSLPFISLHCFSLSLPELPSTLLLNVLPSEHLHQSVSLTLCICLVILRKAWYHLSPIPLTPSIKPWLRQTLRTAYGENGRCGKHKAATAQKLFLFLKLGLLTLPMLASNLLW